MDTAPRRSLVAFTHRDEAGGIELAGKARSAGNHASQALPSASAGDGEGGGDGDSASDDSDGDADVSGQAKAAAKKFRGLTKRMEDVDEDDDSSVSSRSDDSSVHEHNEHA